MTRWSASLTDTGSADKSMQPLPRTDLPELALLLVLPAEKGNVVTWCRSGACVLTTIQKLLLPAAESRCMTECRSHKVECLQNGIGCHAPLQTKLQVCMYSAIFLVRPVQIQIPSKCHLAVSGCQVPSAARFSLARQNPQASLQS